MTDKFTNIAAAITAALKLAGIQSVYIYPDTKLGQNYPLAVIAEGDKEHTTLSANCVEITQTISIFLAGNTLTNRSTNMSTLEAAAYTRLLADITLANTVANVVPAGTGIGSYSQNLDNLDFGGYKANVSVRELRLELTYFDTR
jgi:hypothetical protein